MSPSIHTEPRADGREPPSLVGFTQQDGTWQLQLAYYQSFLEDVTGVSLDGTPSASEIKVVQSRLEGCLEAYERNGACKCQDFEQYEHIDSLETVHELAQFFRVAVAVRAEQVDSIA